MVRELKSCLGALLLVVSVTAINGNSPSRPQLLRSDQNLMQFMVRSSALSHENPTRSLSCFDHYVPLLNGITAEYERSYAACISLADEKRQEIDSSTQDERQEIESSAQNACSALDACNANSNSIAYFECYVEAGSDNSKAMYAISTNSSIILAEIRENYRLIENDQNRCTDASERVYVQNTAATYELLQACLQGKAPVPVTPLITTTSEAASSSSSSSPSSPSSPSTPPSSSSSSSSSSTSEPAPEPEPESSSTSVPSSTEEPSTPSPTEAA